MDRPDQGGRHRSRNKRAAQSPVGEIRKSITPGSVRRCRDRRFGILRVAAVQCHAIFELLAPVAHVVGEMADRQSVARDHLAQLVLARHGIAREAHLVVHVELSRHSALEREEERQDRQGGGRAEQRGEVKSDPDLDADRGRDPD